MVIKFNSLFGISAAASVHSNKISFYAITYNRPLLSENAAKIYKNFAPKTIVKVQRF